MASKYKGVFKTAILVREKERGRSIQGQILVTLFINGHLSSLHWSFSYFLSNFCSTGICSDYTSSFHLHHSFTNTHRGYPLNFIFAFHGHVKGGYLCLAEVKLVKIGVPGVKPLLGVKGWDICSKNTNYVAMFMYL